MKTMHVIALAVIFGLSIAMHQYVISAIFIFISAIFYYLKKTNSQLLKEIEDSL